MDKIHENFLYNGVILNQYLKFYQDFLHNHDYLPRQLITLTVSAPIYQAHEIYTGINKAEPLQAIDVMMDTELMISWSKTKTDQEFLIASSMEIFDLYRQAFCYDRHVIFSMNNLFLFVASNVESRLTKFARTGLNLLYQSLFALLMTDENYFDVLGKRNVEQCILTKLGLLTCVSERTK